MIWILSPQYLPYLEDFLFIYLFFLNLLYLTKLYTEVEKSESFQIGV